MKKIKGEYVLARMSMPCDATISSCYVLSRDY